MNVEFNNMKREPEEIMRSYANRIWEAFHKAYPMEGSIDAATIASREQMMMILLPPLTHSDCLECWVSCTPFVRVHLFDSFRQSLRPVLPCRL